MARGSFLYRLLDLDLLEGLDTTRAQFFGKDDDLSFSRGNEDVNASDKRRLSASRWSAAAISECRGV